MKLFLGKWKKAVCLFITLVLIFAGLENNHCAAQISGKTEKIFLHPSFMKITCSTKSILLHVELTASVMPTKAEIYRAKIKPNGKNGKFRKIANCKKFINEYSDESYSWTFEYEDHKVKSGTAYAYKYKAYCKTKEPPYQYKECSSKVQKGMAAKAAGQYTCKIVKNTKKKLIIKLTGKSKKNGLLKSYRAFRDYYYYTADLRFKNEGENENCRYLQLIKYSYDGKKWRKKRDFSIKGKQSVYLYFKQIIIAGQPENINVSDYQYAQIFFYPVRYNYYISTRQYAPQIRFNLSSGTAVAGNFIVPSYPNYKVDGDILLWDGNVFDKIVIY